MTNYVEAIDIRNIKPARYNPRYLSPEAFSMLKESLSTLGVLKPIIVRDDNTIIAGHQRTKAMLAIGITHCPAYVINDISKQDEVRFNQAHNGSDLEINNEGGKASISGTFTQGWNIVSPDRVKIIQKGLAKTLKEQLKLLSRYGTWGASVASPDGKVLISAEYAIACKALKKNLLLYVLPEGAEKDVFYYFSKDYGVFSYEHLDKDTFIQTLAQKPRLRTGSHDKSTLYETQVIPFIKKEHRVLDFGAGQMDYAKMLTRKGFKVTPLEFYERHEGKNFINQARVNKRIDAIIKDIEKNGLYDVVVCDSVLNSVDSLEAEKSVLVTLSAFCKPLGSIFWSGRPKEFEDNRVKGQTSSDLRGYLYFYDEHNFTANFRNGRWFYQKFHSYDQVLDLNAQYFGLASDIYGNGKQLTRENMKGSSSFQVAVHKTEDVASDIAEAAVKFEFSLPLPSGKRYDRGTDMWNALSKFYE